jgi:hypothetical protein
MEIPEANLTKSVQGDSDICTSYTGPKDER